MDKNKLQTTDEIYNDMSTKAKTPLSTKDKKKEYQKKRKQLKLEKEAQQLAEDHSRVETHPSACSEILQLDREVDSEKNELLELQGLKREIDTLKKNVIELELENARKDFMISSIIKNNTFLQKKVDDQVKQIELIKAGCHDEGYI